MDSGACAAAFAAPLLLPTPTPSLLLSPPPPTPLFRFLCPKRARVFEAPTPHPPLHSLALVVLPNEYPPSQPRHVLCSMEGTAASTGHLPFKKKTLSPCFAMHTWEAPAPSALLIVILVTAPILIPLPVLVLLPITP
jgi:hypothetical protein